MIDLILTEIKTINDAMLEITTPHIDSRGMSKIDIIRLVTAAIIVVVKACFVFIEAVYIAPKNVAKELKELPITNIGTNFQAYEKSPLIAITL